MRRQHDPMLSFRCAGMHDCSEPGVPCGVHPAQIARRRRLVHKLLRSLLCTDRLPLRPSQSVSPFCTGAFPAIHYMTLPQAQ